MSIPEVARITVLAQIFCTVVNMSQAHPTIVVVDDDPDIVEFLCDYLPGIGCEAVTCRPGPQAAA